MARKGDKAKEDLIKLIKSAVGNNFVTIQDKKIYVNMPEDGTIVQFAISITQPKTIINVTTTPIEESNKVVDFFGSPVVNKEVAKSKEEDRKIQEENVKRLRERLGL